MGKVCSYTGGWSSKHNTVTTFLIYVCIVLLCTISSGTNCTRINCAAFHSICSCTMKNTLFQDKTEKQWLFSQTYIWGVGCRLSSYLVQFYTDIPYLPDCEGTPCLQQCKIRMSPPSHPLHIGSQNLIQSTELKTVVDFLQVSEGRIWPYIFKMKHFHHFRNVCHR